jgi:hypothetical protein
VTNGAVFHPPVLKNRDYMFLGLSEEHSTGTAKGGVERLHTVKQET